MNIEKALLITKDRIENIAKSVNMIRSFLEIMK